MYFFYGQPDPHPSYHQLRTKKITEAIDLHHRQTASWRDSSFVHHLRPDQLPAFELERGQRVERQVRIQSSAYGQCGWRYQRQLQVQHLRSGYQSAMAIPQQEGPTISLLPKAGDRQQQKADCIFSGYSCP